ncbi:MAG: MBL fold metallo-hydrolase [Armatimonadetes bacterium]|nr:MBL fold metallo-hydrolase [Armatimonadota bacterium]
MKLWFLGGADEVGASCTLLEVDGKRILVDAGIRVHSGDRLPTIQEVAGVHAILVTHAHTDHLGALPLVHVAYPSVPFLATAPTKSLIRHPPLRRHQDHGGPLGARG